MTCSRGIVTGGTVSSMAAGSPDQWRYSVALVADEDLESSKWGDAGPNGVHSEVGALRRVLVHRPGRELTRLTPGNREALLFDDVPWVEGAQCEHDGFTELLRGWGVEVVDLRSFLTDVLRVPAARQEITSGTCQADFLGPGLRASLEGYLESLSPPDLTDALLSGIQLRDVAGDEASLVRRTFDRDGFLIDPLPNHLFVRDVSAWVGQSVHLGVMAHPARRRESLHMSAIYRHHPQFVGLKRDQLVGHDNQLEGGDLLIVNETCVVVGLSARTSGAAIEHLALHLFSQQGFEEVVAVPLPKGRPFIHLDTLMTMVSEDSFTIFRPALDASRAWRLRPAPGGIRVSESPSLRDALSRALRSPVRLIPTGGDGFTERGEQWAEGHNVLALAPGVVVAYNRNRATNEALSKAGVEVLEIAGSELSRGRGGPRCLSCPLVRD
jgi:arginine deiminase